ncbi:unnamed protein product [Cylindrotheca closterium]|uniref:DOT1 domain-containing protein n=1 Tax=Cylindrotheca closterium TaxID=2856 RepID=A0AAD2FGZ2_9STRA|nr:unnamed protein product [Cylindrotheca closterium]
MSAKQKEQEHQREKQKLKEQRQKERALHTQKTQLMNMRKRLEKEKSPYREIVDTIHTVFGKQGTELAHNGSSTYAEVTKETITGIVDMLKDHHEYKEDDCLFDAGSGIGTMVFRMLVELHCCALGIEYCNHRTFLAAHAAINFFAEYRLDERFNQGTMLALGDLYNLQQIPKQVTTLIMYDEAFPPGLMLHMADLIQAAPPNLQFVVSAKVNRESCYSQLLINAGLTDLGNVKGSKTNNGGATTFTLFKRLEPLMNKDGGSAAPATTSVLPALEKY